MNIILSAIVSLFDAFVSFVRWLWDIIFGTWSYGVIFSWLPSDIISAVQFLILFLFGLAVFKFIKNILPL